MSFTASVTVTQVLSMEDNVSSMLSRVQVYLQHSDKQLSEALERVNSKLDDISIAIAQRAEETVSKLEEITNKLSDNNKTIYDYLIDGIGVAGSIASIAALIGATAASLPALPVIAALAAATMFILGVGTILSDDFSGTVTIPEGEVSTVDYTNYLLGQGLDYSLIENANRQTAIPKTTTISDKEMPQIDYNLYSGFDENFIERMNQPTTIPKTTTNQVKELPQIDYEYLNYRAGKEIDQSLMESIKRLFKIPEMTTNQEKEKPVFLGDSSIVNNNNQNTFNFYEATKEDVIKVASNNGVQLPQKYPESRTSFGAA